MPKELAFPTVAPSNINSPDPKPITLDNRPDDTPPLGTRFWEAEPEGGRKKKYTPRKLADACRDYFIWVEANPIIEPRIVSYRGISQTEYIEKMRAMTVQGLCTFLGLTRQTWNKYCTGDSYERYHEICDRVLSIMYDQKFTGAAADQLNANIIVRELGLAEKTEHSGPNGAPLELHNMSDDALDQRIRELKQLKELTDGTGQEEEKAFNPHEVSEGREVGSEKREEESGSLSEEIREED